MESGLTLDVMATPDAPVTDAQPQATPEQEAQPEQQLQPQPEVQPEYAIELPTGARYRTVEELAAAKVEADRYIKSLHDQMRGVPQQPAPAQVDPWEARRQEITGILQQKYGRDADVSGMVEVQINSETNILGAVAQLYQQQTRVAHQNEYLGIHQTDPDFDVDTNPLAIGIRAMYPNETPRQHYQRFLQHRGGAPATPQTQQPAVPANVRAMFQPQQAQRQQQFAQPVNASAGQQPQADPPGLAQALEDIEVSLTRLYGNVDAQRMATAKQGVRDRWMARQAQQGQGR